MSIETRYFEVNGIKTRVLTAGSEDAPTLLLLHDGGWGASSDMSWERMIPFLAGQFRIVAPDLIGFGATDKVHNYGRSGVEVRTDHVLALLDVLGIHSATFVGSSFGGTMSVRALSEARYRERIDAVVSIGGTGGPWKTPKALTELVHFDGTRVDMQRIVRTIGIDDTDVDYVDRRLAWSHVPGHYETMSAARVSIPDGFERPDVQKDSFPENLRGVTTPLLLVHGLYDDLLDPEWGNNLIGVVPAARFEVLHSGHCPNVSHPEETSRIVADFARAILKVG